MSNTMTLWQRVQIPGTGVDMGGIRFKKHTGPLLIFDRAVPTTNNIIGFHQSGSGESALYNGANSFSPGDRVLITHSTTQLTMCTVDSVDDPDPNDIAVSRDSGELLITDHVIMAVAHKYDFAFDGAKILGIGVETEEFPINAGFMLSDSPIFDRIIQADDMYMWHDEMDATNPTGDSDIDEVWLYNSRTADTINVSILVALST